MGMAMRNSPKVELVEVDGNVIGIALGADFTAEHEWGIKDMLNQFNCDSISLKDKVYKAKKTFLLGNLRVANISTGIRTNKDSSKLKIHKEKGRVYLYMDTNHYLGSEKSLAQYFDWYMYDRDTDIQGAWCDSDFVARTTNKEIVNVFEDLVAAEAENDLFIGMFPELMRNGLLIVRASSIPEESKESIIQKQKNEIECYSRMFDSGIEKILEKAGKKFFALSPSITSEKGMKTAYDEYPPDTLIFWLNPYDQQKYSHGYYTVEDLKDWAQDKGAVIERQIERQKAG
jgi:hypothetical protein